MRTRRYFTVVLVFGLLLVAAFVGSSQAQDDMAVACDSTLITLILVAEHEYGYLSGKLASGEELPHLDYGQFDHIINDTIAMMQMGDEMSGEEMDDMATEESMDEMGEEDMMMPTDVNTTLSEYDTSMGYEMMEGMTTLEAASVAGEPELCTQVREEVTSFLVSHIVSEAMMMETEG